MRKIFTAVMLIQAVFWVVLGLFFKSNAGIVLNILMIADGTAFAFFAFFYNRNLFFKIVTGLFLFINTALTLTDQVGVYDYIILGLNLLCVFLFSFIMSRGRKVKK